MAENQNVNEEVVEEVKEPTSVKKEVQEKVQKQIQKKQEKREGKSRIWEYMATEHKWENYVFLGISLLVLVLGMLILSGGLMVKEDFPLIGGYPKVFAWVLVVIAGAGVLYAAYPFFKPALPEFKKISWLTGKKFLANSIRVFVFIIIFTLLFLLYDAFISQILAKIFA